MFNKKPKAYRIMQIIMGLAIVAIVFLGGMVASFPDWTAQRWSIHFLFLGLAGGMGITAWIAAILISFKE